MSDHVEISDYIKYSLSELGARNGHHLFEELCFHLAKSIVTPDLMFMTGPVSVGGDQGRDFETFRGNRAGRDIVFACTLQKDNLPTKVRSDVVRIITAGRHSDEINVMCAANLAGSTRHDLEAEVLRTHGVHLEVFDGTNIADKLAQPANFWIARRYLRIPESMAPESPTGTNRYTESRGRWLGRTEPISTLGELFDVQESAREIVFDDGPVADLEFWLEHIRRIANPVGESLARKAFYQLAALSLRGTESMHGLETDLAAYFGRIAEVEDEVEVEDVEVLLNYAASATLTGRCDLGRVALAQWRSTLIARIGDLISQSNRPGRRCALRLSLGGAHLIPVDEDDPFPDEAIDAAMTSWLELVAESDRAPYFPIRRVAKLLDALVVLVIDHHNYVELRDGLAVRIHERFQAETTASARDRALALMKASRPLDALSDLHRVRRAWFVRDTLRGTILTSLLIAECYRRLKLPAASKMFLLAAAHNALADVGPEVNDLIPKSVFLAAQVDYEAGAWMGAVELTEIAILLYDELGAAPWAAEDPSYDQNFMMLFAPYGLARAYRPTAVEPIRGALERAGILHVAPSGPGLWDDTTEADAAAKFSAEGLFPFADCGMRRTMTSTALGHDICVTFDNTFEAALAGERFLATLEVTVAAIAADGLAMTPTRLIIDVSIVGGLDTTQINQTPSADGPVWRVSIPSGTTALDVIRGTAGAALAVLQDAVVAGDETQQTIERVVEITLPALTTLGGTYDEFLCSVVPKERWERSHRELTSPLGQPMSA